MLYKKGYFKEKKITVIGLGLLGRGLGDIRFLAEEGAELIVTDLKTEEELKPSLEKLKDLKNVRYVLGEHRLEDFRNKDFILKVAGFPLDSLFIEEARRNNVPVKMSTSLFAELAPAKIVGITGTRGKTTVTCLIYEILKKAHSASPGQAGKSIFLGGNIKDVSTLAHLPESTPDEIAVLELDSWQLQGFGDERMSPEVAVFTTFFKDHLNYYKGNIDVYFEDKANIFKYQQLNINNQQSTLILGEQVENLVQEKYPEHAKRAIVASPKDLPNDWKIKIPGEHNRYNIACAVSACRALGIPDEIIKEAVEEFKGVEGRLEFLREVSSVKIYNDTTATTPEATVAALRALNSKFEIRNSKQIQNSKLKIQKNKNIILIFGGADKGLDMSELLGEIPKFCKAVVTLPGTGTSRTIYNLQFTINNIKNSNTLEEAVNKAMEIAEEGDIILFSPAFASFGPPPGGFKNEYDRGEKFKDLVRSL